MTAQAFLFCLHGKLSRWKTRRGARGFGGRDVGSASPTSGGGARGNFQYHVPWTMEIGWLDIPM
jgi:hypothetical protein